jgi:epoxyqueuosine reductase QueG
LCGRRHATPYIKTADYATCTDCMDACAANASSVDYRTRTRTCFMSDHCGEPNIT